MAIASYIFQICGNMCQQTTKLMHAFYMQQWCELKSTKQHHMWTLLRRIQQKSNEPWLMMGGINEAM
jgi:hypothetical protein